MTTLLASFSLWHCNLLGQMGAFNTDKLNFGDGLNTALAELKSTAVEYDPKDPNATTTSVSGGGQDVVYVLKEITSLQELRERLNVDIAASFGMGMFKGTAEVDYLKENVFTSYNNFLYIEVRVTNETEKLVKKHLTKSALDYANVGASTFFRMCGNEYVYGKETGGVFKAIVQVSSSSASEFESIRTKLSGSYMTSSGSADIGTVLGKLSSASNLSITIFRKGGLGKLPNLDELKQAALNFPPLVAKGTGNPYTFSTLTADYSSVDNLPIPIIKALDTFHQQADNLRILAEWRDRVNQTRTDLQFLMSNPEQFELEAGFDPKQAWKDNEDNVQIITQLAAAFFKDPAKVKLPNMPKWVDIKANRKQGSAVTVSGTTTAPTSPTQGSSKKFQGWANTNNNLTPTLLYTVPSGRSAEVRVVEFKPHSKTAAVNIKATSQIQLGPKQYVTASPGHVYNPKGQQVPFDPSTVFTLVEGESVELQVEELLQSPTNIGGFDYYITVVEK